MSSGPTGPYSIEKVDAVYAVFNAITKLVNDIDDLIKNSTGVAGLHQNGDVAEWDELECTWLASLDEAREIIEKHGKKQ